MRIAVYWQVVCHPKDIHIHQAMGVTVQAQMKLVLKQRARPPIIQIKLKLELLHCHYCSFEAQTGCLSSSPGFGQYKGTKGCSGPKCCQVLWHKMKGLPCVTTTVYMGKEEPALCTLSLPTMTPRVMLLCPSCRSCPQHPAFHPPPACGELISGATAPAQGRYLLLQLCS